MTPPGNKKIRLDEILLKENLINEEQIAEALLRQKVHGGRLGSQLLYYRYISESDLVKALGIQHDCEGVTLANRQIPEAALKLVPPKLVNTRRIVPFEYDQQTLTLKIACIDPSDQSLINELNFMVPGKKVKLYVAAELAIEVAINRYYRGQETTLDDSQLLEIPDAILENGSTAQAQNSSRKIAKPQPKKSVLVISDEEYNASLIQSILQRDSYEVAICPSADEAQVLISNQSFTMILIKESIAAEKESLLEKIRQDSPHANLKTFASSSSLLLAENNYEDLELINKSNLNLLTLLLSSQVGSVMNHGGAVGGYADKLCRRLNMHSRERILIVTAAYLHDLARYYYKDLQQNDYNSVIELTAKLLESLEHQKTIVAILRSMYKELEKDPHSGLPLEKLGGNILTIVDLFCENIAINQKLTLDKFDAIKKRLRDFSGKLFLGEVVEAFIAMIQEEILDVQTNAAGGQVLLYTNSPNISYPLELRLKNEGFNIINTSSSDELVKLCQRSYPDILLIAINNTPDEAMKILESLKSSGLEIKRSPSFIILEQQASAHMAAFLQSGIEDVIIASSGFDVLIIKMKKIQTGLANQRKSPSNSDSVGARGRLADMNLIDLLQALAPARKTVKITLTNSDTPDNKLTLFLNKGNIISAEAGNYQGPEAVYEAISWTDGVWTVEQADPAGLPKPNVKLSNEAILMEGAYRLDEKIKTGKL